MLARLATDRGVIVLMALVLGMFLGGIWLAVRFENQAWLALCFIVVLLLG